MLGAGCRQKEKNPEKKIKGRQTNREQEKRGGTRERKTTLRRRHYVLIIKMRKLCFGKIPSGITF